MICGEFILNGHFYDLKCNFSMLKGKNQRTKCMLFPQEEKAKGIFP